MNIKAAFWRLAHERYEHRRLGVLIEAVAFGWASFLLLAYAATLVAGLSESLPSPVAWLLLVGLPLTFGYLHRSIRLERAKGPDALRSKVLETDPIISPVIGSKRNRWRERQKIPVTFATYSQDGLDTDTNSDAVVT